MRNEGQRTTAAIDWGAVTAVAAELGVHTRRLAAARDAEALRVWASQMAKEHEGLPGNQRREASYRELAVLVAG
jgi:hypothetical protein